MRDLHRLFENGAITDKEFQELKVPILDQQKKLMSYDNVPAKVSGLANYILHV